MEKQFKEVTTPYTKALHEVESTKKKYFDASRNLTSCQAKLDADSNNEQIKSDYESAKSSKEMVRIEYENAVNAITNIYPAYEDKMKQLFSRIQDIEKKRMNYIKVNLSRNFQNSYTMKEIARRYVSAVNLTDVQNLESEYDRVKTKIDNFSPDNLIK